MGLEMRGGGALVGQAWPHSVAHIKVTHTHIKTHFLRQLPALIAALVCLTTENIVCMAGDSQYNTASQLWECKLQQETTTISLLVNFKKRAHRCGSALTDKDFSASWSISTFLKVYLLIVARLRVDRLRSRCPGASQMMYLGQCYSSLKTVFVFNEELRLAGRSVLSAHTKTKLENPTAPHRLLAQCAELYDKSLT